MGDVPSPPFSDGASVRIQLMEGIGPVVISSAAVGSAVIGFAVGGLLGAATFFAVEGLMPRTAAAERRDPARWVMCHAPKNSVECSVNHQ